MMFRRFHTSIEKYYKTLELTPGASIEDIKQAYKRLVKKYHPDTSKLSDKKIAADKFKEIHEAKTILLDPTAKPSFESPDPPRHEDHHEEIFKRYEDFKRAQERMQQEQENREKRRQEQEKSHGFEGSDQSEGWENWNKKRTYEKEKPSEDHAYDAYTRDSVDKDLKVSLIILSLFAMGLISAYSKERSRKASIRNYVPWKPEKASIGLQDPFTGKFEKPLYKAYEYLYRGQQGPHKRFLLLTKEDDENALFKCKTCDIVVSKSFLEDHVNRNRARISVKK